MSKRFGRNQKRKMRAEIDQVRHAMEMDRGLLRHTTDKLQRLEDEVSEWDRRVRRLLGDDSGFAKSPRVHESMNGDLSFIAPVQHRGAAFVDEGPFCTFRETMHRLEVEVHDDPTRYTRIIHMHVGTRGQYAYSVSELMLERNGIGDEGVRYVAGEIARRLRRVSDER